MMKLKNLRPTQLDVNLEYECPNASCNNCCWISLNEARVKNFKIVCEVCNTVFKPKQIDKLKISYCKNSKLIAPKVEKEELPIDTLDKCVTILVGYGFTQKESVDLINNTFDKIRTLEVGELIKQALLSLGK